MASRHASTSSWVISQNGFITDWPSFVMRPVPSRVAAPELIRWRMPPLAFPVSL